MFHDPDRAHAAKACGSYLGYGTHVDTSGAHVIPVLPEDHINDHIEHARDAIGDTGVLAGIWSPTFTHLTVLLITAHANTGQADREHASPTTFAELAAHTDPFTVVELRPVGLCKVWHLSTFTPTTR